MGHLGIVRILARRSADRFRIQQVFDARDQLLRLKWFANKFVGLDGNGLLRDGSIHHSRHQYDRCFAQLRILLNKPANFVTVFVGHDDVRNNCVGDGTGKLRQGGCGIMTGDHVNGLATERNLDDFAHGRAVIDEIYGWNAFGGNDRRLAHGRSNSDFSGTTWSPDRGMLSASPSASSSSSRMASSMRSVDERNTVR